MLFKYIFLNKFINHKIYNLTCPKFKTIPNHKDQKKVENFTPLLKKLRPFSKESNLDR